MPKRRRTRRVKYEPRLVALRVLSDDKLSSIVTLLARNTVAGNAELAKKLGISTGYANYLCRKLEKWGVLRAYRDPVSGRILWSLAGTKVSRLVLEELKKRELENVLKTFRDLLGEE